MSIKVTYTGPLFDGRAGKELANGIEAAELAVAQEGVLEVRSVLKEDLKNPTGHYSSQIRVDRVREDRLVTDNGILYGSWLSGTSSRNQTTRFKGYTYWRRAAQRLQSRANSIAEEVLKPFISRMQ